MLTFDSFLLLIFVLRSDRIGIKIELQGVEFGLDERFLSYGANVFDFLKGFHHASMGVLDLIQSHFGGG